jgi:hypothetical protein
MNSREMEDSSWAWPVLDNTDIHYNNTYSILGILGKAITELEYSEF